jgi:SNF2 family DNA or RNA helicase
MTTKAVRLLNGSHKLALSGTPIENNITELYSLFSFLEPTMFGDFKKFKENYLAPIMEGNKSFTEALKEMIASDIEPMRIFQSFKDSFSLKAGEMRLSDILKQEQIL